VLPLESVPNVSEGRDRTVVDTIAGAFASAGARVLDTHVDADHHRAVMTLVGADRALEDGLVAGIAEARERIDLRRHDGVHPRVGAADVVPVVPLAGADVARAVSVARAAARRVGEELGLPVFLYGVIGDARRPAFFRRGGPSELQRRVDASELAPAYGPSRLDPRAGAVLLGVRAPLLAFNVELVGSLETAREVAAAVRESSGGLPGVQALGLALGDAVQVSTNVIDLHATAPHELVERIVREAEARGARVGRGELVGLVPAGSVAKAAAARGVSQPVDASGLPTRAALDAAAEALRLECLDADRVLEWHLAGETSMRVGPV
jgi:glutamate formiminotransferase / 5-formyltetrahydrofolate cyclo-ligase